MEFITTALKGLWETSGVFYFISDPWALLMVGIACVLMYLAIVKQFEPLLLLPIAFGMLLTNLLGSEVFHEELFLGGHVNWGLFGGAVMVNGKDILTEGFTYMVNAAGQIINVDNGMIIGHFMNAVEVAVLVVNDANILLWERSLQQLLEALGGAHTVAINPLMAEDQDAVIFLDFGEDRLFDDRVHSPTPIMASRSASIAIASVRSRTVAPLALA